MHEISPFLAIAGFFSSLTGQALAAISGSIDTQDVISSDANRDGIPVSVIVNTSSNLAPGNDSGVLRVRFTLLDQDDVQQHGPKVVVQRTISFPVFPGKSAHVEQQRQFQR